MTVATRTQPQNLRALELANITRLARVEARRALREAPNASEARRRAVGGGAQGVRSFVFSEAAKCSPLSGPAWPVTTLGAVDG